MEKNDAPAKTAEETKGQQQAPEENKENLEGMEDADDFVCNPYTFSNASGKEIDYDKLIKHFGTKPITKELLDEFERVTGAVPHIYLRRGTLQ
jgi:hypothetical protein